MSNPRNTMPHIFYRLNDTRKREIWLMARELFLRRQSSEKYWVATTVTVADCYEEARTFYDTFDMLNPTKPLPADTGPDAGKAALAIEAAL